MGHWKKSLPTSLRNASGRGSITGMALGGTWIGVQKRSIKYGAGVFGRRYGKGKNNRIFKIINI